MVRNTAQLDQRILIRTDPPSLNARLSAVADYALLLMLPEVARTVPCGSQDGMGEEDEWAETWNGERERERERELSLIHI